MKQRLFMLAAGAALLLFVLAPYGGAAEAEKPPGVAPAAEKESGEEKIVLTEPLVIKLVEVPALGKQEVGETTRVLFPRGPFMMGAPLPAKEIKKLPKLQAKNPMYGCLTVGGSAADPASGAKHHFVFDQTEGDQPKESDGEKPIRRQQIKPDRLYFDANGDGDLTNDPVLALAKKSPLEGLGGMQAFEELTLEIDAGAGLGKQSVRLVPIVTGPAVYFAPAVARQGKFQLGGREYIVQLNLGQPLTARFDAPTTNVEITPATGGGRTPSALASGPLGSMRVVGGELCTLTTTPRGDQLTIAPYKGDTGMLEVGAGGRAITRLGVTGLLSAEATTVPMGDPTSRIADLLPRGHKLPVGDYAPTSLLVDHGRLRFAARTISDAYLAAAGQTRKPPKYNIQIRKDKPFALTFSGKPEVIFLGPKQDQEFKVGSTILIRVMLAEPENGLMITGLWSSKEDGEKPSEAGVAARQVPLVPTITINNAKGEEVAQGKLPFG